MTQVTVTTLTLTHISPTSGTILHLLSCFPNLASADVTFGFARFIFANDDGGRLHLPSSLPIVLPALASFTLRSQYLPEEDDYKTITRLLGSHIRAPSLTSLSILFCASDENILYTPFLAADMVHSITTFMSSSSNTLRNLVIRGFPRSQNKWDALLSSIPSTVETIQIGDHLHISSDRDGSWELESCERAERPFQVLRKNAELIPRLRSLELYGSLADTHVDDLLAVVRDRKATLRKVYFFAEGGSEETDGELRGLSAARALKRKLMEERKLTGEGNFKVDVGCLVAKKLPQLELQNYE
ncbi:hypothetical protein AAF712_011815 [Marasmius tenuissimus]|uniref:Uncharacterized protein n=1 Tax=Marasmius tenuissimus TaxID=585030 RepID=A0ABR2ZJH8_9AGAR